MFSTAFFGFGGSQPLRPTSPDDLDLIRCNLRCVRKDWPCDAGGLAESYRRPRPQPTGATSAGGPLQPRPRSEVAPPSTNPRPRGPQLRGAAGHGRCCRTDEPRRPARLRQAGWPATGRTACARPVPGHRDRRAQPDCGCGATPSRATPHTRSTVRSGIVRFGRSPCGGGHRNRPRWFPADTSGPRGAPPGGGAPLHGRPAGPAGRVARNRIGVDDFQFPAPNSTRQGGLAAPVRAGDKVKRRHCRKCRPTASGGLPVSSLDDLVPVPGPRNPRAVGPDAVEGPTGLDLGREIGLDPVAPVLPPTRHVRWRGICVLVLLLSAWRRR